MNDRLWYPQLDVFDTARRICGLLQHFQSAPGTERLYIADFYLANPPLLHYTSMPMDTRRKFQALKIIKPGKSFLSYPSPSLLFHKMEAIQKQAVTALSGKGLISIEKIKMGYVEITDEGRGLLPVDTICTQTEMELVEFLVDHFVVREEVGNLDLRRRTGLRRPN